MNFKGNFSPGYAEFFIRMDIKWEHPPGAPILSVVIKIYFTAMVSISTIPSLGSLPTWKALRAGGLEVKKVA